MFGWSVRIVLLCAGVAHGLEGKIRRNTEELSQAGFILLHINPWLQFRGTLLTIVVSWDLTKQTKRERK